MLILLGVFAALTLLTVCIVAPLRQSKGPAPNASESHATLNAAEIKIELNRIADYRAKVAAAAQKADTFAGKLASGLKSGSKAALAAALKDNSIDDACAQMSDLKAPNGLAGAKESVVTALFSLRALSASIGAGLSSQGAIDASSRLAKIAEARAGMQSGLKAIDDMMANLSP